MPAQVLPSTQPFDISPSINYLLAIKKQALEDQLLQHELEALPLKQEYLRTQSDRAKFQLAQERLNAPIQARGFEAQTKTSEAQAAAEPGYLATRQKAQEAAIGASEASTEASRQATSRGKELLPMEKKALELQGKSYEQAIVASNAGIEDKKQQLKLQTEQMNLQHQNAMTEVWLAGAQHPNTFYAMKNNPELSKDPYMSGLIRALPDEFIPANSDQFAAHVLNYVMNSNDPMFDTLRSHLVKGTAERYAGPAGAAAGKAEAFAQVLNPGGGQADNQIGQAMRKLIDKKRVATTATQTPTLQRGELGPVVPGGPGPSPTQETPNPVTPGVEQFGEPVTPRIENHIQSAGRLANLKIGHSGDKETGDAIIRFTSNIPVDPSSGLSLTSNLANVVQGDPKTSKGKGSTGQLQVNGTKNPYYTKTELKKFAEASDPSNDETLTQTAYFTGLISDLAKMKDPPPDLLLSIAQSPRWTRGQVDRFIELGDSLGWRMALISAWKEESKRPAQQIR